jgi:hypothetical protein
MTVLRYYARLARAYAMAAFVIGPWPLAPPPLPWPTLTYFACEVPWFAGSQVATLPMQTVDGLIKTYSPVRYSALLCVACTEWYSTFKLPCAAHFERCHFRDKFVYTFSVCAGRESACVRAPPRSCACAWRNKTQLVSATVLKHVFARLFERSHPSACVCSAVPHVHARTHHPAGNRGTTTTAAGTAAPHQGLGSAPGAYTRNTLVAPCWQRA